MGTKMRLNAEVMVLRALDWTSDPALAPTPDVTDGREVTSLSECQLSGSRQMKAELPTFVTAFKLEAHVEVDGNVALKFGLGSFEIT
jgi:hypothetical protein